MGASVGMKKTTESTIQVLVIGFSIQGLGFMPSIIENQTEKNIGMDM